MKLFQGCADAFHTLGGTIALPEEASTRMRLTVTATDSEGYEVEQEGVIARDHRLELRFRHVPRPVGDAIVLSSSLRDAIARAVPGQQGAAGTDWPFPESATSRDLCGGHAANLLARSTRTTASFPVAFAPSALAWLVGGRSVSDWIRRGAGMALISGLIGNPVGVVAFMAATLAAGVRRSGQPAPLAVEAVA